MKTGPGAWFVQTGCFVCHSIAALKVRSPAQIGPDLSTAVEDTQKRFGLTVDQFLALADQAIAGNLSVLNPYGARLADLNIAASCMNDLFDNCDPVAPAVGLAELAAAGAELGDMNDDERHSSSDLVLMINYIFKGAQAPKPYKEVTDFNYDYFG